ncbi:MAG TPA: MerR family transcriptional regulator [Ktedonobacteraceae bacterium]|nr:MerR family transcriptional regulator [Ktedonobacteraceae bacterium]
MQEPVYTTTEVAHITGFSLRQLDYWAREKMIMPSFQQAHGSGSRRLYAVEDLVQLNIVRQLKKHNWSTQKIHKAIETLKDIMNDANPLRNAILVHGKGTIFALSKTRKGERILIDALNTTGQQVMSFVLETLLEEVKSTTPALDTDIPVEVAHTTGGREP